MTAVLGPKVLQVEGTAWRFEPCVVRTQARWQNQGLDEDI
jgi:hypothetical protein